MFSFSKIWYFYLPSRIFHPVSHRVPRLSKFFLILGRVWCLLSGVVGCVHICYVLSWVDIRGFMFVGRPGDPYVRTSPLPNILPLSRPLAAQAG